MTGFLACSRNKYFKKESRKFVTSLTTTSTIKHYWMMLFFGWEHVCHQQVNIKGQQQHQHL